MDISQGNMTILDGNQVESASIAVKRWMDSVDQKVNRANGCNTQSREAF